MLRLCGLLSKLEQQIESLWLGAKCGLLTRLGPGMAVINLTGPFDGAADQARSLARMLHPTAKGLELPDSYEHAVGRVSYAQRSCTDS